MRGVEFTTVATAINGIGKSDREVAHEQATLSPRWSIFPYAILDRCCCQIPELGGHLCKIVAPLLGSCRMTGNSEATWVRSRWGRVADNPTGRPQRSLSVSPLKRNAARFRDRAKTFYPAFFRDLFSPAFTHPAANPTLFPQSVWPPGCSSGTIHLHSIFEFPPRSGRSRGAPWRGRCRSPMIFLKMRQILSTS